MSARPRGSQCAAPRPRGPRRTVRRERSQLHLTDISLTGKGVVTGSLRINVSGLAGEKTLAGGPEVDIPYIEDTSATKPKVRDSAVREERDDNL